ncbi:hypothetical protein [Brevibacterium aurantiacum]|uniref:hypothetical protein n=1 Tax=Brevibacterium aurantiacum TaxID=273384 RepID=UPI000F646FD8|nr:hypothetical protein [Brevibacterium aurantiacum]AZL08591.1 hypothetical protein CXR26_04560 [Brevibacterium aurantiacum]
MPKKLLATLAAATLIITGCSAPTETSEAEAPPASQTEETGTTVEQFASIIAESRRPVDDWLEDAWDANTCSASIVAAGDITCDLALLSGTTTASTAYIVLDTPTKIDAPGYIGDPPKEVAIIWQSTKDAAEKASDAGEEIPEDCSTDPTCASKVLAFDMAMYDLQGKYDSWAPYM